MANFLPILKKTFSFEGGYQNFPTDTANYNSKGELVGTNHGISAKALEAYTGKAPTVQDIKNITEQLAQSVYKKLFWEPLKGDSITNDSLAHIMFDAFIASGYEGLKRVKKGINIYYSRPLVAENKLPISVSEVALINKAQPDKLFNIIKQGEIDNRNYLATANPAKYGKFLKGWLNRLNQITFSPNTIGIASVLLLVGLFFLVKNIDNKN